MKKCFLFLFASSILFFHSCSNPPKNNSEKTHEKNNVTEAETKSEPEQLVEVGTFEVKDSSGKHLGYGYDIFVNKAKAIHQPSIPAISGIYFFKSKEDAFKTGTLAADKMRSSGFLPTLTINELDSLGVIPKPNQ